jgi:hypothetical protein
MSAISSRKCMRDSSGGRSSYLRRDFWVRWYFLLLLLLLGGEKFSSKYSWYLMSWRTLSMRSLAGNSCEVFCISRMIWVNPVRADFAALFISGIWSICVAPFEVFYAALIAHCSREIQRHIIYTTCLSTYFIILSILVGPIFRGGVFTILFHATLSVGVMITFR